MTTSSPSEARIPVSRDVAKPRKPPTRVRPLALAAWAGSEADPSVRLLGLSTGGEPADEDGKTSEVETFGGGQRHHQQRGHHRTASPASAQGEPGDARVPAIDCHMATSPHTQQATQASTHAPRARSTDCAAATAMSAVDPASE